MIIDRKIKLKTIVTEEFKKQVQQEIQDSVKQIEAEVNYLDQRYKKIITELTIKASPQAQGLREQLEWEKKKREEAKAGLLEQMKKLNELEEGTEVIQGETTGPVELKIGDNWDRINNREIVVKNGIIVEIR
ncbi:MAG: hypothetical protein CVU87_04255 [Firmicutes bacterium HGW-Firmicutes-12]|jgi:hypothetical protein|nr:MAG: hypothetical protein CVU87_04255 [Firmicutes bacterium HGW-Firmicutes-12]